MMAGRFTIENIFKAVDNFTRPVNKMEGALTKFTRSANKNLAIVNKRMDNIINGAKNMAQSILVGGALVGGAFAQALKPGIAFEQAITDVGAVSFKTRDDIKLLEEQALSLGKTTKFTATQSAKAMEVLARAGFDTQEILAATPAVLNAAAASGLGIAEVAEHVSNALKGMGLDTTEASRVANVLTLASSKTNSSIGSLGSSITNVAVTAKMLNIPLEEVVASVALLQDAGIDASVAGSSLNSMLTKLAKPTDAIKKKMEDLRLSFKDANGDMLSLPAVLDQINKAAANAGGNFDKVAFLADLVGMEGQKAAGVLGKMLESDDLEKLIGELKKHELAAKKMADLRMNTVEGSIMLLGSAIDAVQLKMFNLSSGPIKDVIDKMTEWVGANGEVIASGLAEFIVKVLENLPQIASMIELLSEVASTFIVISSAIKIASAAMVVFKFLLTAPALAVAAIGFAVIGMFVFVDELLAKFEELPAIIQFALSPIKLLLRSIKFIKDGLGSIGSLIGGGVFELFNSSKDDDVDQQNSSSVNNNNQPASQVTPIPAPIPPQERTARSIEEQRTTSTAEVLLRTETGTKAELTKGKLGTSLQLAESGGM
mgnify:CR=1 FL=1